MGNCMLPFEIKEIENGTISLPLLLASRANTGHTNEEANATNTNFDFGNAGFGDNNGFGGNDFGNSGFGGNKEEKHNDTSKITEGGNETNEEDIKGRKENNQSKV